jgi:LysM repeat protein
MKNRMLPVRRKPATTGLFTTLRAKTHRRQRVAAAGAAGDFDDEAGSKISRALTIIFLIHIVAIGLIFVHQKFLSDKSPEAAAIVANQNAEPTVTNSTATEVPQFSNGGTPYVTKANDSYQSIANTHQVDEDELRAMNNNVELVPKLLLALPQKRGVAMEEPAVIETQEQVRVSPDDGLVPVNTDAAPKATPVRVNAVSPSGKTTHVVKPGETLWAIAKQHGTTPDAIMKANSITDARKVRAGASLQIP